MRIFLLLFCMVLIASCERVEEHIITIDARFDSAKDKAIDTIIEKHKQIHADGKKYVEWLEQENKEDAERLEKLKAGFID